MTTRENVEELLSQSGHAKFCGCMPCRLIRLLLGNSEERVRPCEFEDCAAVTISPPGAEPRLCAGHRCPQHSEGAEPGRKPAGECAPPCTYNCGCDCPTCQEAREERAMLGHREGCRCTDCGCLGDRHGDCGIRCLQPSSGTDMPESGE